MDRSDHRALAWFTLILGASIAVGPARDVWAISASVAAPYLLFAGIVAAAGAVAWAGGRLR